MKKDINEFENMSALEKVNLATQSMDDARTNTLDDEQRIKILSPGMLVLKRFIRNKLAITGLIILVIMFIFSFIGPLFSPYGQTEIFTRNELIPKKYASATHNTELRATTKDGKSISSSVKSRFVLANNKNKEFFEANGNVYRIKKLSEDSFVISLIETVGTVVKKGALTLYPKNSLFTPEFKAAFEDAMKKNDSSFVFNDIKYTIAVDKFEVKIGTGHPYALMSKLIYHPYTTEDLKLSNSFDFKLAVENAVANNENSFVIDNIKYEIENIKKAYNITAKVNGENKNIVYASDLLLNPINKKEFIGVEFIKMFKETISNDQDRFVFPQYVDGESKDVVYKVLRNNANYDITTLMVQKLHDTFGPPSKEHLVGTDDKAFDMLTRLMFGGRISLLVGFVVVFIEIIIGVLFGGISGYFGGWIDTLLMRFVDLFNCIPYWPIMIIAGAVMDTMEVDSTVRIFLLMFIMGFMGWTGIARVVRGQILMLREQDFMVATEATGLSIKKRIFRHLVPNVMPLLIVQATMSLGGIIITEATLSFLGLGVKPPLASWGSIINAANNIHVMQNAWWVWIPTGFLIVLTVLGFNFVGDGLRDAYDPKMKR